MELQFLVFQECGSIIMLFMQYFVKDTINIKDMLEQMLMKIIFYKFHYFIKN